jgi:hypothetical protein
MWSGEYINDFDYSDHFIIYTDIKTYTLNRFNFI